MRISLIAWLPVTGIEGVAWGYGESQEVCFGCDPASGYRWRLITDGDLVWDKGRDCFGRKDGP
jgi:hypothetical protein